MRGRAALALALLAGCGEPPLAPPRPVALVLTASDTVRAVGGDVTFTAVAVDSEGAPVAGVAIAWGVSNAGRGRITPDGRFTAGPNVGPVWVRAVVAAPPLAESVLVRTVAPGTVKWIWAAAGVGGVLPSFGGPVLAPDGTVYALVGTGGFPDFPGTLVALSPEGAVRWTRPLLQVEGNIGPVVTPGSDQVWVVGKASYLVAPDGTVLWDTVASDDVGSSLLSGAATTELLVAAWGRHVTAYRATDHALVWTSQEAPLISWLVPATITAEGRVLAKRTADTLFVFAGADGRILRSFLDPDTALDKAVFGVGTVPVGDRYLLPTVKNLAAFDTGGPLLWLTENIGGRGVTEPAVAPSGTLFVQNRIFGLQALNPDGSTKWYRRTPNAGMGWREMPQSAAHGGPALAQGGVLYSAGQGAFFAHSVDGEPLWEFVADSADAWQAFLGAPAIAPDGTVYTFTSTHVYAFYGPAGPEPNSPWPMWRHDAQRTGWAR